MAGREPGPHGCGSPPVPPTSPAFVQAGGSVPSGSGCPWRWGAGSGGAVMVGLPARAPLLVPTPQGCSRPPGGGMLAQRHRYLAQVLLALLWLAPGSEPSCSQGCASPVPRVPSQHSPGSQAPGSQHCNPLHPWLLGPLSFRGGGTSGCLWAGGGPPPPWVTFLSESRALWTL